LGLEQDFVFPARPQPEFKVLEAAMLVARWDAGGAQPLLGALGLAALAVFCESFAVVNSDAIAGTRTYNAGS
jgi:hypothetical protein